MRERGRGHIIQISSIGGVIAGPNLGAYHASKWAPEALSESLAAEVARFGIRVTIVEPGGYDTDWGGHRPGAASLCRRTTRCGRRWRPVPGGPAAAARALLEVVDAEEPPLRVLFGSLFGRPVTGVARATYDRRLTEWAAWEDLSMRAYGR